MCFRRDYLIFFNVGLKGRLSFYWNSLIICFVYISDTEVLPTKRRDEEMDTLVMDTKLKIIEILKVRKLFFSA